MVLIGRLPLISFVATFQKEDPCNPCTTQQLCPLIERVDCQKGKKFLIRLRWPVRTDGGSYWSLYEDRVTSEEPTADKSDSGASNRRDPDDLRARYKDPT